METGAFAMFDALGVRGIWEKHDPDKVVRKFEAIAAVGRNIVDRDFGGPGHPNTQDAANFVKAVRVGFLSDTVVVGFVNKEARYPVYTVMMAARYAGEIAQLGLAPPAPWAYRGVVTYGNFALHDSGSFFVGPAVDEAADCYERANAALIWLAPSARTVMEEATPHDFQGAVTKEEHNVPLKPRSNLPTTFRTRVVSPLPFNRSPSAASATASSLLDTFDLSKADVAEKHRNTEAFLKQHLKEYATAWRERQALLRLAGL